MMSSVVTAPPVPQGGDVAFAARASRLLVGAIGGAWLIAVVAQFTGNAALLHHHALIEGGRPLWVGVPLFLLAWQVMIAAMMLPASLPSIRTFVAASRPLGRPGVALAAFLAAYAAVWTAFGLVAFLGDVVLHQVVDATPWLAARPGLIEAGVLAVAGAYQFVPLKRRFLSACRHPAEFDAGGLRKGLEHALDCLGCSWALMLVMFAAGFANLWFMAVLAAVMAYETMGRYGQRATTAVGVGLLALAVLVVSSGVGAV